MKLPRILLVGLPLLALILLFLLSRSEKPSSPILTEEAPRIPVSAGTSEGLGAMESFDSWLRNYQAAPDPSAIKDGVRFAIERRKSLKVIIERDPQLALELTIPLEQRVGLPAEVVEHLEVPISAGGEFEKIVSCYLGDLRRPKNVPEFERFVTVDGQRYRAFTYGRRVELQTKDRISLHGIAIDDVLALDPNPVRRVEGGDPVIEVFGERRRFADDDEIDHYLASLVEYENSPGPGDNSAGGEDGPVANSAWTEGNKTILYLRVRFADQDPAYEPITLATAQSRQADVAEHFRLSSYGKMLVTTVFPDVITLSMNKSEYVGQGLGLMMNEARDLAITMGQAEGADWDYNNYDFYTIVSDGGIGGYAGVAQVGGRKSHLQSTSLRTAGHEFGHNFGLVHSYYNYSSDLSPRGETPTNGLGLVEYGHRFSLQSAQSGSDMSNPALPHFTAHEKWRLDWLTDADFTDVTSGNQSGTFRIYQSDDIDATGRRAVRVPSGGALSKYWLSYRTAWRQPLRSSNNDYLLNGILFNWTGSGGGNSTLLDMTPYSDDGSTSGASWTRDNNDKWDAPLLIGRTYTDTESRVSVTPVARGGAAPDEYIDVFVHLATGQEIPLVGENDACQAIIPDAATATGITWADVAYDDSTWPFSGPLGVGYDETSDYVSYFGVDVEAAMNNQHETCYIRIPFSIDASVDLSAIAGLKLRMRYDDGFVAYINGVKVAEANAPVAPTWDSGATGGHGDSSAVSFEDFDAAAAIAALVTGGNVLSIHGMNDGQGSSDFLIQPTLSAVLEAGSNTPPTVSLASNLVVAGVNQDVTFTATGADVDGDTLAYAWDFDIGDTFAPEGLNNPVAVRRWSSAGLYAVTITCSDRKGGIARDRILVKVGSPSSSGIVSGRVLRGGQPVAGARVFVEGADTQCVTLADGSYVIAGLSTSSANTIGAMFDGEVFQAAVSMPVLPAPELGGVDFYAHSSELLDEAQTVLSVSPHLFSTDTATTVQLDAKLWDNSLPADLLIPFGDTWTYLDTGVDPGSSWVDLGFDDSSWLSGPAELGYGDDQATVISFGADSQNRHITSWFRRAFAASDIAGITRLKLSVKRDDGVRIFLNGAEIVRDNLTTGTVTSTTKASNDVSSANEAALLTYSIDPELLLDGQNMIAAEIHQEDDDSSDLSFDLELSAARNISEVTPVWSVIPAGATVSASGVFSASDPGVYTVTASSGGVEDSAEITVVTDNEVRVVALDGFVWENAGLSSTIRVSRVGATDSDLIVPLTLAGDASSGSDYSAPPSSVTILAGETFAEFNLPILDDSDVEGREVVHIAPVFGGVFSLGDSAVASVVILDDENLYVPEPIAGVDTNVYAGDNLVLGGQVLGADLLVGAGDYWKFDDSGTDLGSAWRAALFADGGWQEGIAKFGYGDGDEITTVSFGDNSSSKQITTYFRRRFYLDDPAAYSALEAKLLVDDGAVVYINGSEVLRENLPGGAIGFSTRAQGSVGGDDEETFFPWSFDQSQLVAGENVVAVEVHQSSPTSSDLGFDMSLRSVVAVPPSSTSFSWQQISGPGTAAFIDVTNLTSGVSFDQPGTYVLGLEAMHSGESYSDTVTITVDPVPDFSTWVNDLGLASSDPLVDLDGDGWGSLMEFSAATDPDDSSSRALADLERDPANSSDLLFSYKRLRALLPEHTTGATGDGYQLYGLTYTVEVTDDPNSWQDATSVLAMQADGAPVDNGDGSETVTVRLTPPAGNGIRWFVRLSVVLDGA